MIREAEHYYRRALASNPRNAVAMNNLGALYASQDRHAEASDSYRKALEVDPRYGEAHFNLGLALVMLDKQGEAIEHLGMAVQHQPPACLGLCCAWPGAGQLPAGPARLRPPTRERSHSTRSARDVRQLLEGLRRESPSPLSGSSAGARPC